MDDVEEEGEEHEHHHHEGECHEHEGLPWDWINEDGHACLGALEPPVNEDNWNDV